MKASIRFRDDRRPLVRAKVPLTILGLPFSSAISAGDAAELQLDLSTAFPAGPALRFSYRPNDPADPFRVAVRTGAGALGSPVGGAPMSMSAEFSVLPHGGGSPRFMLTFKPRLGDFGVRRVAVSEEEGIVRGMRARGRAVQMQPLVIGARGGDAEGQGAAGGGGEGGNATEDQSAPGGGAAAGGGGFGWKANGYVAAAKSAATYPARAVDRLLSGTEITARTLLPLRSRALVKVRWGVRVPSELRCAAFADDDVVFGGGKSRLGVPFLVMSKLSIEHVTSEDHPPKHKGLPAGNDLAEACSSVRRQLEALREENGMLRKAVDALRMDFAGRKDRGAGQDGRVALGNARGGGNAREEELRGGGRKPGPTAPSTPATPPKNGRRGGAAASKEPLAATTKDEVNEELRKALMDATSAGIN